MEEYWDIVDYEYDFTGNGVPAFIVIAKKKKGMFQENGWLPGMTPKESKWTLVRFFTTSATGLRPANPNGEGYLAKKS